MAARGAVRVDDYGLGCRGTDCGKEIIFYGIDIDRWEQQKVEDKNSTVFARAKNARSQKAGGRVRLSLSTVDGAPAIHSEFVGESRPSFECP